MLRVFNNYVIQAAIRTLGGEIKAVYLKQLNYSFQELHGYENPRLFSLNCKVGLEVVQLICK